MNFKLFLIFLFSLGLHTTQAQNTFLQSQKNSFRVSNAFLKKEGNLQKEFAEKGFTWPAKFMYIRSFKFDSKVEIWLKNDHKEKYRLFKTYRVCMQSGTMGPKRLQGDFQIPEGFYYIDRFNPNSQYHLSLGLNYPNASDRVLSDSARPGNGIYIHGSCVSVGCVAVNDDDIEEIYTLAAYTKSAGQEFIPVHIFPVNFNTPRSVEYLNTITKNNPSLEGFFGQLKKAFQIFEETRQLPVVMIQKDGEYVFSGR